MPIGTVDRGEVSEFEGECKTRRRNGRPTPIPTKSAQMVMTRIGAVCMVASRARGKTKGGNGEAFRCAITPKVYFSFLGSTVYNFPP